MNDTCDLAGKRCRPCEGGIPPLDDGAASDLLATLPGWTRDGPRIAKTYPFANHYEAMAFVNAVAWVSHCEDHHPDLAVGYRDVRVSYTTHAIGGLSDNDFICAAKIEKLLVL
ncbi:MAG: 4a-hydroxytetrahydrobiopterin dehydratase [Betaproteobacteria bacterium]|nr:4a-hydroxytetrahydrobiopterin dehydratase [Betaproteobacteria bacterium]